MSDLEHSIDAEALLDSDADRDTGDSRDDSFLRAAARTGPEPGIPLPGTVIDGQFEVRGELGRGGMGVVLLAHDLRLDREVAVKVMRLDRWPVERHPKLRATFVREARATARLSHPHLVTLYHFGEDPERMYLVLERLHGETLDARLARGPLPRDAAIAVALAIAEAVSFAHAMGVLHRDLKPQNVFLCDDGRARVLDFGLAAMLDEDGAAPPSAAPEPSARAPMGATTHRAGTPGYMAPEQWLGAPQDARTDLWALGVCVYELLADARPVSPRSVDDLRSIPPLSSRRPDLPRALDRAVSALLAFDRDARPTSVAPLVAALTAARDGHARRRTLIAGGAVALALLAGGGYATWRARQEDLSGTWAYTPGGQAKVMISRTDATHYLFEFTDAEPGTRASARNFYIRGELALVEADGKRYLRGTLIDVPGWGKGQVGFLELEIQAEDRLFMTQSLWGKSVGNYHHSYPPWLLVRVDERVRGLGLPPAPAR